MNSFSSSSPLNNQSSDSSENSASSDSSESEGEEDNRRSDEEEDSSLRSAQAEVKNEPPEENEVKKWNLGSFFPPNISTEQKSPNEAPQSNEPVKAVKNINHGEDGELPSDEDESNDDSDEGEIQQTPPSEHNFNHHNENSNNSSIPDKSSDHEQSMPPPANRVDKRESPNKTNEMEKALSFIKTLQPIQPIQPLLSLSDSDGKMEMPTGGSPMKKKKPMKRTKPPVSVQGDSSSDEENSQYPSKNRRRKSLDNTKIRGRPPKKSSSSNSLPASYEQQPISECNGTKKLSTPQHKSPRGSLKDAVGSNKKSKNVKSRETVSSTEESNNDEEEIETRSPSKKIHQKSVTPRHPELSSSKKHAAPRSSSSASSSSSSSQSDSDHSTKKSFPRHTPSKIHSPVPPLSQSRPSSSLQHHLPPAASSVHRNDSSDQSDSDDSRHNVTKGKVKEAKNPSGDKNKHILLGKLFARPQAGGSNSEGLGKGGKNGGKKPIGQVVVVTEETKLSNDNLSNCHVQNHHPKYSTASPSSAFSNNISSASNLALNPSVIVRIDLSRLDLRSLGIPIEKLKAAGLLKSPQVPVNDQPPRSSSSNKKRRRSTAHDDDENETWSNKKHKQVDRLSVSSSTSTSSSSSSSSDIASNSRVSFPPIDRLNNNNNIDHKQPPPTSYSHSPSSVDTKMAKVKRESQHVSPMKSESKPKVKQEKSELDESSQSRHRRISQPTYKDVKKIKKMKSSHDDNLSTSTTQVALVAPTNHDRLSMVNGDTPVAIVAPSTIIKPVYVSYFERNNDSEQPEMR